MSELKYKVGDRVRIKSLDWYNENKSKSHGTVACGGKYFDYDMREWCGKTMTILTAYQTCYIMREDGAKDLWTDEMIEGLVEEDIIDIDKFQDDDEMIDIIDECVHRLKDNECQINLLEGYIFKDENGNIINATKIVLEKKKEYPKTYAECCRVLGVSEFEYNHTGTKMWYRHKLMATLDKLMLCRDAYWKLYGEEMGLGKPWEPDWNDGELKWCMSYSGNYIEFDQYKSKHHTLAFPTEEMRDAFKKNFDPDIEICKELL